NQLAEECRDLRIRLQRQQRYTLQFKAALEKCLEVPPPSYGATTTDGLIKPPAAPPLEEALPVEALMPPLFPKASTIKPWSSPSEAGPGQPLADRTAIPTAGAPAAVVELHGSGRGASTTGALRFQSRLLELARQPQPLHPEEAPTEAPEAIAPPPSADQTPEPLSAVPIAPPATPVELDKPDLIAPQSGLAVPGPAGVAAAKPSFAIHNPFQREAAVVEPTQPSVEPVESDTLDEDSLWRDLARLVDASMDDIVAAQNSKGRSPLPAPQAIHPAREEAAIETLEPQPEGPADLTSVAPAVSDEEIALADLLRSGVLQPVRISPSADAEPVAPGVGSADGERPKSPRKLDLPRVATLVVPTPGDRPTDLPDGPLPELAETAAVQPDQPLPPPAAPDLSQGDPGKVPPPPREPKIPPDWPSPTLDGSRGFRKPGLVDLPAFLRS
ncbi:MAG: hypothetical protein VKK04_20255, partial [Synechococcales bacterium]|nr:hypothetical protein [Synechococcales bacterium]